MFVDNIIPCSDVIVSYQVPRAIYFLVGKIVVLVNLAMGVNWVSWHWVKWQVG